MIHLKNLSLLKIVIVIISLGIVAIVAYINGNKIVGFSSDIKWILSVKSMETVGFNYPSDVSKLFISGTNFSESVTIENVEDIDRLMNMFNSLELVERNDKKIDYSKNYIDLGTLIPSAEAKGNYGGHIVLSGRYIYIYPSNYENIYSVYYVKYPEFSFQDDNNQITQYIKSLTEKNEH